jgi:hypothetical protein
MQHLSAGEAGTAIEAANPQRRCFRQQLADADLPESSIILDTEPLLAMDEPISGQAFKPSAHQ